MIGSVKARESDLGRDRGTVLELKVPAVFYTYQLLLNP